MEMTFVLPAYTWGREREQCYGCKHYEPRQDRAYNDSYTLVMLCKANPYRGVRGIGTCIDNRTRGPCGKDAKLFEAAIT